MDEKKGIERRKFIKGLGKGLVVAAYVAPAIISFTLSDQAEAKSSGGKGHGKARGKGHGKGRGKGHGRISPPGGSGSGGRKRRKRPERQ